MTPTLALMTLALGQFPPTPVGYVDLFGQTGVDAEKIRQSIPIHEGDTIDLAQWPDLKAKVEGSVTEAIGKPPTDVALVGFDTKGRFMVFVGLPGPTVRTPSLRPTPKGPERLPHPAVQLYEDLMKLEAKAVQEGNAHEDDSKGYALSSEPSIRSLQLRVRDYAKANTDTVGIVLRNASDARHRWIAACFLGYADRSTAQLADLASAATDPSDAVRNNAIRAIGVIVHADSKARKQLPATVFADMVCSGVWTDRNKGAFVLEGLTQDRDPAILKLIRERALPSLLEMARWRNPPHAKTARILLGRIGGIPEPKLQELADKGDLAPILEPLHLGGR